jgi:hypothetical protein
MWTPDVSEAIWRSIGGLERIQAAEILFSFVRQYEDGPDQAWIFMEGAKAPQGQLRDMRGNQPLGGAPSEWEQGGQFTVEHTDDVCTLPCSIPSWEFGIARTATGVPSRVDRLRCLGNAVVPQCAQYIGERIVEYERESYRQ